MTDGLRHEFLKVLDGAGGGGEKGKVRGKDRQGEWKVKGARGS